MAGRKSSRTDGAETRKTIIETAGRLIAENGFAMTTGKAICEAAGVNPAAVNYHFGSREAMYAEVLAVAHDYLINLDDLARVSASAVPVEQKMDELIDVFFRQALLQDGWQVKVLLRELMSPSAALPDFIKKKITPKLMINRGIFQEYLGADVSVTRLRSVMITTLAPLMILAISKKNFLAKLVGNQKAFDKLALAIKQNVRSNLEVMRAAGK